MTVERLITDHIDIWSSALQTRSTAGRGSNGKIDLYGIKKLRELILELAVRGKLVPQDPNDEPASELLKCIAVEKAELVKQGKIKKQKPLPKISEDEKPFELPVGWEVIRLGEIAIKIGSGSTPRGGQNTYVSSGVPFLRSQNIWNDGLKLDDVVFITSEIHSQMNGSHVEEFDILLNITGASLGRCAIYPDNIGEANVNQHVTIIRLIEKEMISFLHLAITSPVIQKSIWGRQVGMAIEGLSKKTLELFEIPVPPLLEQLRIVHNTRDLMSLCDQLEQQSLNSLDAHQQLVETLLATLTDSQNAEELAENWARISQHFDMLFTTEASIDTLKQTILQLAVMGKLVPQDPNDEPASELLKRIQQEKVQLVKEGKIKKQKPLPPISDDEKPFELPQGWEWCRLGSLFSIITDGDHQAPPKASNGVPFLVIGNLNKGDVSFENSKFVPKEYFDNLDWSKKPTKNDMLYTVTGSYGIPIIVKENYEFCVQRHVAILKSCSNTPNLYLKNVFLTSYAYNLATNIATGIAQKTVPLSGLRIMCIPLPPANEIARIMEKLQNLDVLFSDLKSRLQSAQQTQLHLADALTDAALN
ncbi:restriction endonuclease subunit S [Leclercia sp.]|uniref:restriction endonuclease subunit S n=1 Tax=Leclercia sp. TaxID=1898428 RepID=UPI0028987393|nr:restriction endonuclease subunit S [Leclercia sp.]